LEENYRFVEVDGRGNEVDTKKLNPVTHCGAMDYEAFDEVLY
jgi:hypothetical protein